MKDKTFRVVLLFKPIRKGKLIMKTKIRFFYYFMSGIMSVFGFALPTTKNMQGRSVSEDTENLKGDWRNIGGDITKAYEQFKSESC